MPTPILNEIRLAIEHAAGGKRPEPERRFHKDDQYRFLRLKTVDFWEIMKRFKLRVVALSLAERMELAAALLAEHVGELGAKHGRYLDRLADDFRGWSHVDHFCG